MTTVLFYRSRMTSGVLFLSLVASSISFGVNRENTKVSLSTLDQIKEDTVEVNCNNDERLSAVQALFEKMGAQASDIVVEKIKKVENVTLRKQGSSEGLIVIGAHYDKASVGCGAVDNWSGIVTMAHVYRSLRNFATNRSLIFVAFGKEENGRVGSKAMVKAFDKAQSQQYCAMINFDSLGLGAPQVLENISSKKLTMRVSELAKRMEMPFGKGVLFGPDSDSSSFIEKKIPAVTIHGLAGEFRKVIHTPNDQSTVVNATSVYLAYRLALSLVIDVDKSPCDEFR